LLKRFVTKGLAGFALILINGMFLFMFQQEARSIFVWLGLTATIFIIGVSFPFFRERASGFQFIISVFGCVGVLSYLDLALQLMQGQYWKNDIGLVMLTLLVCFIFLLIQIYVVMGKAQRGKKYLIETKKLDVEAAKWDFDKFLYLEDPKKQQKNIALVQSLRFLLPFGPVIGYFLNRNYSANTGHFILGLIFFVIAFLLLAQIGLQTALGIKIREWETEMGLPIRAKD
jgi:hypothetical protein